MLFKLISAAAIFAAFQLPAFALSVKDYVAKSTHDQAVYAGDFIEKMTADIGRTNPQMMQAIRTWFTRPMADKPFPEGTWNCEVEIGVLQDMAKEGKADLSKIQIEGVIVKVVKDKFLPAHK